MVRPERPSPDEYDHNEQIEAHFSDTPGLTPLPRHHRYYEAGLQIKRELSELYSKYRFQRCPRYGIFLAGYLSATKHKDRDKYLLLAVELREENIKEWWKMDAEVRQIMRDWDLSGQHGVCVRYYKYWEGREDDEVQDMREDAVRLMGRERSPPASRPQTARHDSALMPELERTPNTRGLQPGRTWVPHSPFPTREPTSTPEAAGGRSANATPEAAPRDDVNDFLGRDVNDRLLRERARRG